MVQRRLRDPEALEQLDARPRSFYHLQPHHYNHPMRNVNYTVTIHTTATVQAGQVPQGDHVVAAAVYQIEAPGGPAGLDAAIQEAYKLDRAATDTPKPARGGRKPKDSTPVVDPNLEAEQAMAGLPD